MVRRRVGPLLPTVLACTPSIKSECNGARWADVYWPWHPEIPAASIASRSERPASEWERFWRGYEGHCLAAPHPTRRMLYIYPPREEGPLGRAPLPLQAVPPGKGVGRPAESGNGARVQAGFPPGDGIGTVGRAAVGDATEEEQKPNLRCTERASFQRILHLLTTK